MNRRLGIRSLNEALVAGGAVIVIGLLAYEVFETGLYEPPATKTGWVTASSNAHPGERVTARTRLAAVGRRTYWQVEVAPGAWKDCGSDCAAVLRRYAFKE